MKFSRNLFSRKRLYGSLMYCGRLQKKAKAGNLVGSWVMYLTFMYLPFQAGGGVSSMIGSITSFSFAVVIIGHQGCGVQNVHYPLHLVH